MGDAGAVGDPPDDFLDTAGGVAEGVVKRKIIGNFDYVISKLYIRKKYALDKKDLKRASDLEKKIEDLIIKKKKYYSDYKF